MADITTNEADKVERIAKHELIATKGGAHLDMSTATGIRYTDKETGMVKEFIMPLPPAALAKGLTINDFVGSAILMLGLFGGKTKATNETSRIRNGKGGDTTAQMEALDDFFDNLESDPPVWREKAEGGGGTRTDKAILAQVLVEQLGTQAKGDAAFYVARMENEKGYIKNVLSNDAVRTAYNDKRGKVAPALDSLA